jgi:hypothetical protein
MQIMLDADTSDHTSSHLLLYSYLNTQLHSYGSSLLVIMFNNIPCHTLSNPETVHRLTKCEVNVYYELSLI